MSAADFEAAKAHFLDGVAHLQAGRAEAAEHSFEASLARLPGRPSTLVNLAAARLALGKAAQAMEPLDAALAAEPADPDAWWQRGRACTELGRHDEACDAFQRVVRLAPAHREARYEHAVSLHRLGRLDAAAQAVDTLLREAPRSAAAWSLAGQVHRDAGRPAAARSAFERAIAEGADAEVHRFLLAALDPGAEAPPTAPESYVRGLFDGYAGDFEPHLLQALRYRAHRDVVEAARTHGTPPWRHGLDLGCGSGLVGTLLRGQAQRLTGVDLSAPMVERAAARGAYDEVIAADVVAHLQSTAARHDLVTAADVFIYVGELEAVFAGVRRVIEPGGLFCFSVESHDGPGFVLRPSLRYAHGEAYLRTLAARHGLAVAGLSPTTLREEQRVGVAGHIVALRAV